MKDLTFTRIMMVSDRPITKDNPGEKRIVWVYNDFYNYPYMTYPSYVQKIEDIEKMASPPGGWLRGYKYAKDYKEPIIELTLEEIADRLNIDVNQLRIKD